jgi:hypothetical protein
MTLPSQWLFLKRTWVLAFGLVAAVFAWDRWGFPLLVPFRLDPDQPYRIEFGRGSGWHGLNTVRVEQDGGVTLHRERTEREGEVQVPHWETATLRLPPEGRAAVLAAVVDTRVLGLARAYHEPGVRDGTQWVLWVKQGEREKAVYCDNRFPPAVKRFAERLDAVLNANGMMQVEWRRVPQGQERQHEQELWDSIER